VLLRAQHSQQGKDIGFDMSVSPTVISALDLDDIARYVLLELRTRIPLKSIDLVICRITRTVSNAINLAKLIH
jgi:hypothetical protein